MFHRHASLMLACFLFLSLWLIPSPAVHACSCVVPPPPAEALDSATAVFAGTVKDIRNKDFGAEVIFEVTQTWKGIKRTQVVVTTGQVGGACGYPFTQGTAYLVYAHQDTGNFESGELSTNICSRTVPLDQATEDLAALGPGTPPTDQVTMEGNDPFGWAMSALVVAAAAGYYLVSIRNRHQP